MSSRIELDEVDVAAAISGDDPGSDPTLLSGRDRHWLRKIGTADSVGSAKQLFNGQGADPPAVGEPAGVGDLADRVDVHRPSEQVPRVCSRRSFPKRRK